MATATLDIDLDAIVRNWRTLDSYSTRRVRTAAVVKADGYGTGAARVAQTLANAGVRTFFVAVAEEGAALREAIGPGPEICIFSGHMRGDTDAISDLDLIPMLNSPAQVRRHLDGLPGRAFGVQLDTGMNRLGLEPQDWAALRGELLAKSPRLVMSHLACADEPGNPMNARQLRSFRDMTDGIAAPRSLAATGGILLGQDYHFDLTRPGVGLYGGQPFDEADPVVTVRAPVIQTRWLEAGETVGYGNSWTAARRSKIATISAGYADGLIRAFGPGALAFSDGVACPIVGRVSMDLITVDITALGDDPGALDLICEAQTVDEVADAAGTIGYEILTSLGRRYDRRYLSARA